MRRGMDVGCNSSSTIGNAAVNEMWPPLQRFLPLKIMTVFKTPYYTSQNPVLYTLRYWPIGDWARSMPIRNVPRLYIVDGSFQFQTSYLRQPRRLILRSPLMWLLSKTLATNSKNKFFMIFLVLKVTRIGGIMVQFWNLKNIIASYFYQALMN